MESSLKKKTAIWVITPNGKILADKISQAMDDTRLFCSERIRFAGHEYTQFQSLADAVRYQFHSCRAHIFIASTGIAVRMIAPLIQSKLEDPAVVVVDDRGQNAVSLLSGHIGGANDLTCRIAHILGANTVITTATDVNQIPAVDVVAKEKNLFIENPQAIKSVNMALLTGEKFYVHDPRGYLGIALPNAEFLNHDEILEYVQRDSQENSIETLPVVYVDDIRRDLPGDVLVLRPPSLVCGIGCNRNTTMEEMKALLEDVLAKSELAAASLTCIASIDVKADEGGLIALADHIGLPIIFFNRQELNRVKEIKNPSKLVQKHVGVKSVCEAAAILAAKNGTLIVPKHSTKNATVALARIGFSS